MQINRLFEIVYLLLDKRQLTAKELADYFEVSTRTIYRDVDILSGAGIPIYMNKGKGGGITLLPEYVLNKTVITEQEKSHILSSLKGLDTVGLDDMHQTLHKVASLFGSSDADWIEVDFGFWSDGEKEAELFQSLKQSILQKHIVRFFYINIKGQQTQRLVEPVKLVFKGSAWYLQGFCRQRQDFRFFKLKRIRDLEVLEETFVAKIPEKPLQKREEYEKAKPIKVKMRIEKEAAFRAYDDFEYCELQEDGSLLAESSFGQADWAAELILSYGEKCQVLEPLEFREEIRRKLCSMLEKYK